MIHMAFFFYIFLKILLSIYHIMLLATCATQVKKRVKKEKKEGHEKFASRGFEPGPSEYVRTKSERLYPPDHLGKG